jgi:hypothetical protein
MPSSNGVDSRARSRAAANPGAGVDPGVGQGLAHEGADGRQVRPAAHGDDLDAPNQYRRLNVHWIEAERQMNGLGVSSKLNARMDFLLHLKEIGRDVAERWIAAHFDAIGDRSTIDKREEFL